MMMRRLLPALAVAALFSPLAHAQTSTWKPDPAHSGVSFVATHLTISKVPGHFNLAGGEVDWNEADITKSKVSITIDAASVNTNNPMRDGDLKSDHFFDVAKYPTATFTSTSISKSSDGLVIAGDLTVHGITKPVTLQVTGPKGPVAGMDKKSTHMGFSATTTVNRSAFNLGSMYPMMLIGDEIALTIDLDLAKQ